MRGRRASRCATLAGGRAERARRHRHAAGRASRRARCAGPPRRRARRRRFVVVARSGRPIPATSARSCAAPKRPGAAAISSVPDRSTPTIRKSCGPRRAPCSVSRSWKAVRPWRPSSASVRRMFAGRRGRHAAGAAHRRRSTSPVPVALVVGNEVARPRRRLPARRAGHIPMAGPAESLNVAMAGTVLCFEVARQRRATATREDRAVTTLRLATTLASGRAQIAGRSRRRIGAPRRSTELDDVERGYLGKALGAARGARGDQVRAAGGPQARSASALGEAQAAVRGRDRRTPRRARRRRRRRSRVAVRTRPHARRPRLPRGHLHLVTQVSARARGHLRRSRLPRVRAAPRSRTTGTTSRRSTSRSAIPPARCRTRSTSSSASPSR